VPPMAFWTSKRARRAIGSQRGAVRALMIRRRLQSGACQLRVQASKDGYDRAAIAEGELESPPGVNQASRQVHQLLHHRADAPALGAVPWRGIRAEQAILPDPAQDVVSKHGTGEDQRVGGELSRGQTLDVQIGLELAVVLLGGTVVGIQGNDRLLLLKKARPPALDLDLGDQQLLTVLVDGALDDTHDTSQEVFIALKGARFAHIEQSDALAWAWLTPIAMLLGVGAAKRGRTP